MINAGQAHVVTIKIAVTVQRTYATAQAVPTKLEAIVFTVLLASAALWHRINQSEIRQFSAD